MSLCQPDRKSNHTHMPCYDIACVETIPNTVVFPFPQVLSIQLPTRNDTYMPDAIDILRFTFPLRALSPITRRGV